jgi:isoquinoline 1-oxidoreductase beta subunit
MRSPTLGAIERRSEARAMLVATAAERWRVAPESITVSRGVLTHTASGRKARFGELVAEAAKLPVPAEVKLKEPKEFVHRCACRAPTAGNGTGTAMFTCT